ncbi:MAG: hypothetical protein ACRDYA_10835 [Egibacteraceae bacterium]
MLLTSRRDERGWLGDLPARVVLPSMPSPERVQLARAVADKHGRRLADVEDWLPLLKFTQGNPLTVTVLVGQALRDRLTTREQIEGFVDRLRAGAAAITDDAEQGRDKSLGASLSYGLDHAFTDHERAQLALLHLFQGFVNVDALCEMGRPNTEHCVPEVRGLALEAGIALLDRAAEIGLLTCVGTGLYAIHPALPWFFYQPFTHYYGPSDHLAATQALQAYAETIGELGHHYHNRYEAGQAEMIGVLRAEEANLLRARDLARNHGWWDPVTGTMQGLSALYKHTGRAGEWRRLVDGLVPDFVDWDTNGPLPGREPEALDNNQQHRIHNLAVSVQRLGTILWEQQRPDCVPHFEEPIRLFRQIGARREEAIAAFRLGHAYLLIPGLRDLDQAEHWYRTSLELYDQDDKIGHAQCADALGGIAFQRFLDARDVGSSEEALRSYLNDAAAAYHQALDQFPDDAINNLAVTHHQLATIYARTDDLNVALVHYQQAIHYRELGGDRYGAGGSRFNAAIALTEHDRLGDALLYAQAALRDYEQVGAGATAEINQTKQLIAIIEQHLA